MFLLLSPANYEEPLFFKHVSELVWCWEKCMRDRILWTASPSSQQHGWQALMEAFREWKLPPSTVVVRQVGTSLH